MQMKLKQLRTVRIPIYECDKCGAHFECDSTSILRSANGAAYCANEDRGPLIPSYTTVEVG